MKSEFFFRCPAEKEFVKIEAKKNTSQLIVVCIIHFSYVNKLLFLNLKVQITNIYYFSMDITL